MVGGRIEGCLGLGQETVEIKFKIDEMLPPTNLPNEEDVVDVDDHHEPSDDTKNVVNECNNESSERF